MLRKFTYKFTYKMAPEKTACNHFCPSATQSWLACERCELRIPDLHDANWQAPWFPTSSRQSLTHLRNAEGGCFGGLKRKVLVLNAPDRQKRPKNGPYQGYEGRTEGRHRTSSPPPYSSSRPKAQLHLVPKSPFNPFVRSGAHDCGPLRVATLAAWGRRPAARRIRSVGVARYDGAYRPS